MKQILWSIVILTLMTMPKLCLSDDCGLNKSTQEKLSNKFNIEEKDICKFMHAITNQVIEAQNFMIQITNSDVPYKEKISDGGLIDTTIKQHYINADAVIQVFSKNNDIHDYYIKSYLKHLADLSYKGIYSTVKLIYYQDNMQFIEASKIDEFTYSIQFQAFEEFIGCKTADGERCYNDVTSKYFYITVINPQLPNRTIKINSMSAIELYESDKFHKTHPLIIQQNND